jgi:hypothetical protein
MTESVSSSETSVSIHQATGHSIPEVSHTCRENLKSHHEAQCYSLYLIPSEALSPLLYDATIDLLFNPGVNECMTENAESNKESSQIRASGRERQT